MKFEAGKYRAATQIPEFFDRFLSHYDFVTKFLIGFNENRFNFKDDVKQFSVELGLLHGTELSIQHKLGYTPVGVSHTGRVEMLNVISRSPTNIVVKPKLLSTILINPLQGQLVQRLVFADPTLFKIGDTVKLGDLTRKIRLIQGNTVTLDESVLLGSVYSVSLATETSQIVVY